MGFRAVYRSDDPKWRKSSGQPSFGEAVADFINPYFGDATSPSDGWSIPTNVYSIASGESFSKGALVRLNGSNELTELTLVTQTVKGVALEAVVSGSAQGVITNKACIARVARTNDDTDREEKPRFAVQDVNNVAPSSAHVGVRCAISLSGGEWEIDIADTANQDVEVVDILSQTSEFIVFFLDAAIQS